MVSYLKNPCKYLLLASLVSLAIPAFSQLSGPCYTEPYNQQTGNKQMKAGETHFEEWLAPLMLQNKKVTQARQAVQVYRIPVVVHIIHDGEAVGQGSNFSDAQVRRQIEILNNDFRRRNADTIHTPSVFMQVAADTYIQFELASKDPGGAPTTGIVRKDGSHLEMIDDVKTLSYWPAEDYMNIWVKDFHLRTGGFAGYAQFPVSGLPGLEDSKNDRLTDGVVVNAVNFGENTATASLGRTLVHETGHFLGLLHIWGKNTTGQDACQHDDFCRDTPNTAGPNYNCDFSKNPCTPDEWQMPQNFMDYAKDACMNLFTCDQMMRMRTVLENSPRRLSLLTSSALAPLPDHEPKAGEFLAYPNPAKDELQVYIGVKNEKMIRLEILTLLGEVVQTRHFSAEQPATYTVNVSHLPGGIYLARVQGNTASATRRIMITK